MGRKARTFFTLEDECIGNRNGVKITPSLFKMERKKGREEGDFRAV